MAAHYDLYDYQKYWKGREYEHESEKLAVEALFNQISHGGSWLEVGAGFGRTARLYCHNCTKLTLLDPSTRNLSRAKNHLSDLPGEAKFKFIQGRAQSLPFHNKSFDGCVIIRVLHHFPDPSQAIKEISRVLKPRGYLILEFANKLNLKNALLSLVTGRTRHITTLYPEEKRSQANIARGTIPFVNHHPKFILNTLNQNSFRIISLTSVSNLRHPILKKVLPTALLLKLEKLIQIASNRLNIFIGPSIFILAQKNH